MQLNSKAPSDNDRILPANLGNPLDLFKSLIPRNRADSNMDLRKYYGFENNPDKFYQYTARNAMTKIYRNYYAHWVDYDIMLSISALIGLAFAMESYNRTFSHFHNPQILT